jgi:putative ABC transport system substrate-binding protein
MNRRGFITLAGAAFAGASGALHAQSRVPVIGLLSGTDREVGQIAAIEQGLEEARLFVGRDVEFEYRWADGRFDRLPVMAQELVDRRVALILAMQSPLAPLSAKAATATIPIVFSIGGDPVRLGLVSSLARPGANVTGATFLVNSLGPKRLELTRELVPVGTAVGLLVNPKNPSARAETDDVQKAAPALGLSIRLEHASSDGEIEKAWDRFSEHRVGAVAVAADAVFNSRRVHIIGLAVRHRLPAIYFLRDFIDAGVS